MAGLNFHSTVTLSTGAKLPIIGFGALNQADAKSAIVEALKIGYRQVDGAQMYENEEQCGAAIRESGLKREEIFITTKIGSEYHDYDVTARMVDEALKKWDLDYFDLFLVHDPLGGKEKRMAAYRALLDAKKAGKIRSVGVSNYGIKHLEEIKEAGLEKPAVNQIEIHPYLQQQEIVKYCKENGIVLQAYCPLIRGKSHPVFEELAKKHNKQVAQILLRWSLQKGYIPLPKSGKPERIQSNTQVFDFELSAEDISRLDALDKGKEGACSWNPVDAP